MILNLSEQDASKLLYVAHAAFCDVCYVDYAANEPGGCPEGVELLDKAAPSKLCPRCHGARSFVDENADGALVASECRYCNGYGAVRE